MLSYHKDLQIRQKYMPGYARTKPVKHIVIHGTGGASNARPLIKWMLNPGKAQANRYRRGIALFHYMIDRDGDITELIDPDRWVYHASIGKMDGGTIGIELGNPSRTNSEPYTDPQYVALGNLIEFLLADYRDIDSIISHRYAKEVMGKSGTKNCPGNFDWELLSNMLKKFGVTRKAHDCLQLNL